MRVQDESFLDIALMRTIYVGQRDKSIGYRKMFVYWRISTAQQQKSKPMIQRIINVLRPIKGGRSQLSDKREQPIFAYYGRFCIDLFQSEDNYGTIVKTTMVPSEIIGAQVT